MAAPEKSLAELLARRMQTGQPIAVRLTLAILRQVAEALDWAHNLRDPNGQPLGVVHRDVSPAYILIAETGVVRLVGSTAQRANCAYMAPELIATGFVDARADLFALGVVAHEMLTNRPLFAGADERETIERVCTLPIPAPSSANPDVPPDIDGLVFMALARDPAYRWQTAAMMRDGLSSAAQRLGLELADGAAWVDLLAGRIEPVAEAVLPSVTFAAPPPVVAAPAPAADPPRDPELWADDTNLETKIRPADPSLLDDVDAFMATVRPPSIAPVDKESEVPAEPVAQPEAPAPDPPTPRPHAAFELEIPEATQIGAVPLIEFGETAIAVVGQKPQQPRASKPTLPPPVATFLPEATLAAPEEASSKRPLLIVLGAIALVVATAAIVFLLAN